MFYFGNSSTTGFGTQQTAGGGGMFGTSNNAAGGGGMFGTTGTTAGKSIKCLVSG